MVRSIFLKSAAMAWGQAKSKTAATEHHIFVFIGGAPLERGIRPIDSMIIEFYSMATTFQVTKFFKGTVSWSTRDQISTEVETESDFVLTGAEAIRKRSGTKCRNAPYRT